MSLEAKELSDLENMEDVKEQREREAEELISFFRELKKGYNNDKPRNI